MQDIFPAQNDPTDQKKPYWKKTEGKIGLIFGVAALAAAGYWLLPILTTIVWNATAFMVALGVAGLVFFVLTDKRFRSALSYLYQIFIKSVFGQIFKLDPFIIAEDYIRDMEKNRDHLYNETVNIDGQKEALQAKIKEKERERQLALNRMQAAKKQGEEFNAEFQLSARNVKRAEETIVNLTPLYEKLSKLGEYLTKVHKNSKFLVDDAKAELAHKKDMYKAVTTGQRALSAAMRIFQGDPDKKQLVEQSMEFLKDDMAQKLASMKKAIDYSGDFMRSIDLDNATFEEAGLKMLENFDSEQEFKLLTSPKEKVLVPIVSSPGKVGKTAYRNLLDD